MLVAAAKTWKFLIATARPQLQRQHAGLAGDGVSV